MNLTVLLWSSEQNLHVSISAPASLPDAPKWIRMNLPWETGKLREISNKIWHTQTVLQNVLIADIFTYLMKKIRVKILTNREELSFRTVLALPKASSTGLVWTTWSSKLPCKVHAMCENTVRGRRVSGLKSHYLWQLLGKRHPSYFRMTKYTSIACVGY